jgi:exoribonuclease R
MKKKLGEIFEGIIINIKPSKIIVELDRYPITGIILLSSIEGDYFTFFEKRMRLSGRKQNFVLTQKLKVLVSRIDDDIYFQLVS